MEVFVENNLELEYKKIRKIDCSCNIETKISSKNAIDKWWETWDDPKQPGQMSGVEHAANKSNGCN